MKKDDLGFGKFGYGMLACCSLSIVFLFPALTHWGKPFSPKSLFDGLNELLKVMTEGLFWFFFLRISEAKWCKLDQAQK